MGVTANGEGCNRKDKRRRNSCGSSSQSIDYPGEERSGRNLDLLSCDSGFIVCTLPEHRRAWERTMIPDWKHLEFRLSEAARLRTEVVVPCSKAERQSLQEFASAIAKRHGAKGAKVAIVPGKLGYHSVSFYYA
jgi:hypothetical protein